MNLKTEQRVKNWLGLILKVLLIGLVLFKIVDFLTKRDQPEPVKEEVSPFVVDTAANAESEPEVENTKKQKKEMVAKESLVNAVTLYIFNGATMDRQMMNHIGKVYFKDYTIKAPSTGFHKEQLLLGNLGSSANTALICVGTVSYLFKEDGVKTSCELSLHFDTYKKKSGEIIGELSNSMIRYGIGFSENQAKDNAMGKVHP